MIHPVRNTKNLVKRHRTAISFSAGVLVGASVITYAAVKYYGGDIYAIVPPEKLKQLLDDPSSHVHFPFELSNVFVISTQHPTLKQ